MDDDAFFEFCVANRDYRIERTAQGDLEIMHYPEGFSSGLGGTELIVYFVQWAKRDGTGIVVGPDAGFTLPNKAMRAPDVAWIRKVRLKAVPKEQRLKFLPLCPDFALELRSPTDSLPALKRKMTEYIRNGAQLGWLLDPPTRTVHIYRPNKDVEILDDPGLVSGDPVLKGFRLEVRKIWALTDGEI